MAGLQLIAPTVSMLWVSSSVRAPARADASAASVPAWPPPTTMTSKLVEGLAHGWILPAPSVATLALRSPSHPALGSCLGRSARREAALRQRRALARHGRRRSR
jgi:hypothetical protein